VKLLHIIIRDDDADEVADALVADGFYITRLASTGGFLRMGNTVFISGIEDDQLDKMVKVIQAHTQVHVQPPSSRLHEETRVSRAVIFIQDMEKLQKL
jgi:uncharacterized protein YaaQ